LRRCFLPLFLSLLLSCLAPHTWADIEPSLGGLLPVYFITDIQGEGNAQVLPEGQSQWQKAKTGGRLEEGDRILVGDDTEVILSLKSETLVHLDEDTEMTVAQLADSPAGGFLSRLKLLTGAILSDVKKNLPESQSSFEVDAGGVVCGVRGTVFEVSTKGDQVQASTDEGVVQVATSQGSEQVKAGNSCSATKGGAPRVRSSTGETKARFQAWRTIRQRFGKKRGEKGRPNKKIGRLGHFSGSSHGSRNPSGSGSSPTLHGPGGGHR
jgi:hypothetical protein